MNSNDRDLAVVIGLLVLLMIIVGIWYQVMS
jgi:hypothetical protein